MQRYGVYINEAQPKAKPQAKKAAQTVKDAKSRTMAAMESALSRTKKRTAILPGHAGTTVRQEVATIPVQSSASSSAPSYASIAAEVLHVPIPGAYAKPLTAEDWLTAGVLDREATDASS